MGYYSLFCHCASCHTPMLCNPDLVPSIRIKGVKEPVCESCVERWNTLHPDTHFTIPTGAYYPAPETQEDLSQDGLNAKYEEEYNRDYFHDFDDKDEDNE